MRIWKTKGIYNISLYSSVHYIVSNKSEDGAPSLSRIPASASCPATSLDGAAAAAFAIISTL
jgi:hypothetical protein